MWNKGYVSDTEYSYGYFPETASERVRFLALVNGLKVPKFARCCELGFGQGVTLLANAASDGCEWWGTDFNTSQASSAACMAQAAGLTVKILADDFETFASREDVPAFDYIVIHGIWSWIPEAARRSIVQFIEKKLKLGGFVYLSYNTLPGWSTFSPVQKLMLDYVRREVPPATKSTDAVLKGIDFCQKLLATNSTFGKINPHAQVRLSKLSEHSTTYLAHEYLNESNSPMFFSEVHQKLSGLGLDFVASADWENNIPDLVFDAEQQSFLAGINDLPLRENSADFFLNTFFRRDIWSRGTIETNISEKLSEFEAFNFIRIKNNESLELSVKSFRGVFSINNEAYRQIVEIMPYGKLINGKELKNKLHINLGNIDANLKMLVVLLHAQIIELCCPTKNDVSCIKLLNENFRKSNYSAQKVQYALSSQTGLCYKVSRFNQIFSQFYSEGNISKEVLAEMFYGHLTTIGQSLQKEGRPITSEDDLKGLIAELASTFLEKELPRLKMLQIL